MSNKTFSDSLLPPRWLVATFSLALFVWLLVALREIVALLVIAFAISYLIEPVLKKFATKGIRRSIGIVIIALLFIALVLVIIFAVLPVLSREISKLVEKAPSIYEKLKLNVLPLISQIEARFPNTSLSNLLTSIDPAVGFNFTKRLSQIGLQTLLKGYSITLTIVNLFLLPFIVFYISTDFPSIRKFFVSWFSPKAQKKVNQMISEIDLSLGAFVRGQLTVCTILFFLYAIGLKIIGVELWLLLAFIAGFANIVPYLGLLLGLVSSTFMAFVTFGDYQHVLMVLALFAVVQFLEGTFITPKVVGDKVGLSPLAVILAILAGGSLLGLLGIFLAIPAVAVFRVIIKNYHAWLISQY